ncbi:30S ribosomal protein S3 [Candidatus Pacearchaeota archaeon]|nr:30S ribosomal protein S3 [Candidatus Pacearchaeota archaeon]MBD3282791.1 30S ribosomal protein S3 [Candidatus Pacearchaeota archaeon]
MEERKFIKLKKEEYGIKEYIKRDLGKGKISKLDIEYTPVGEKIVIHTSKPGFVIGRRGEKIDELTNILKKRFKLENPHIEIREIESPLFDAQLVADEIALALERMGNLKFKVIAYRKLQDIMNSGALGCELRISGKLPSERSRSWRFAKGYLKKSGESKKEIDRASSIALTKTGIIGIKVAIMGPKSRIYDKIDITEDVKEKIKSEIKEEKMKKTKKKKSVKKRKKKKSIKIKKSDIKEGVLKDSPELKQEENGTAMRIEEEIEEGVPQDIIDKELEESNKDKTQEDKNDTQK